MTAQLNHTIIWCNDPERSARFLAEMLGRPAPRKLFHFVVVDLDNDVSLDFAAAEQPISPQHYAFLIGEDDFDAVFARIKERKQTYWADPARREVNAINRRDGGRGFYFEDPDGHFLEVLTRPYGSGGA